VGVPVSRWEVLFNPGLDFSIPGNPMLDPATPVKAGPALHSCVEALLPEEVFNRIVRGGPFGRAEQVNLAQIEPRHPAFTGMSVAEMIQERQRLWDDYQPWPESLARLFDAVQEEVLFQRRELNPTAGRAEAELLKLSRLQQIAYKHVVQARLQAKAKRTFGEERWLALMRELDHNGVRLDEELSRQALEVLRSVRKKGAAVTTWEEAYSSKATTSLEDGKVYTLKRTVMHAVHNAAKNAAPQFERIWGTKTPARPQ
jgi:hypothetical protein